MYLYFINKIIIAVGFIVQKQTDVQLSGILNKLNILFNRSFCNRYLLSIFYTPGTVPNILYVLLH